MTKKYSAKGLVGRIVTKSLEEKITASRQLLQNPYAHLNDIGSYDASPDIPEAMSAQSNKVAESRKLLKNQYAYLDDQGGFSAAQDDTDTPIQDAAFPKLRQRVIGGDASLLGNAKRKSRHSDIEIERRATDLQRKMWQDRSQIWPNSPQLNPIDVLDPAIALGLIGYDYDLAETLGQYFSDGKQVEVAGIIDDSSALVQISRQFPYDVRNFTAAHELGHALLHDARGLHRDRPLDGAAISRDPIEYEADKFASYFLMPGKLVRACFAQHFGTDKFILTEETRFALTRGRTLDLERNCRTLRGLSRVLTNTESYNGVRFKSLASLFRVSAEAMAIRLEELGLLAI